MTLLSLVFVTLMRANEPTLLDGFESVADWKATPSDGVSLAISQGDGVNGKSMRLDFDFHGHGGYAVVRRNLAIPLPANYEFSFSIRGEAPVNTLEFKLVDPTGDNVWWSNQPAFAFPREWKTVSRKKRHITFAWGPIGGGDMKTVAAIEIAITAGSGGKGTVWIDDLAITPLEPDAPYTLRPRLTAVSSRAGYEASRAMDASMTTSWRPNRSQTASVQFLDVDFQKRREFGGLVLDWERAARPSSYEVSTSLDGRSWTRVYAIGASTASRDYLYLPESEARYLRFTIPPGPPGVRASSVIGLREITVQPLGWSASMNEFFTAVARDAGSGSYPKYFSGVQSYWTVIGVDGDTREALINEQGMIESGKGQFSIEPFLRDGNRFVTWRDAKTTTGLTDVSLPMPFVTWQTAGRELRVTAFAAGDQEASALHARYRVRNLTAAPQKSTLYLAIRPFQVNPSWQFLNTTGGFAPIDSISLRGRSVRVNAGRRVVPISPPSSFGAMAFDEGNIIDVIRSGHTPPRSAAVDRLGRASGVLAYEISLRPKSDTTIDVAIPLHDKPLTCESSREGCTPSSVTSLQEQTRKDWDSKLGKVGIELPGSVSRVANSIRSNLAYILINRDGASIQPGSRSYERSWIRDGALTSTALLRLGHHREVRDFIDWYSRFQFDNGKIPCCVDSRGADPVPENDSHGEFIYLVAEYFRHTGDRQLIERRWQNVARAFDFMDSLRLSRKTEDYRVGDKRIFYGLLPQSISHEGYSAKPMHSYWDDFFALRGFKDATELAQILRKPEAARYAAVRDEFRKDFYESIRLVMATRKIDYIPGAAELADFDATSTTIAVSPVEETGKLSSTALNRTFAKYYENFRIRRDSGKPWENYTPYELRVVGTFVRLGDRDRAHELLDFFFRDQRPAAWNQWGEVVWRDPKTPKFVGDIPHTWVGSDFIRSALDMFAYEREADSSLVIGAGIPMSWVRGQTGVRIRNLSTHYGPLTFEMRGTSDSVTVAIAPGVRVPPGGIVVQSPSTRRVRSITLNGKPVNLSSGSASAGSASVVISVSSASVTFRY
ncbi:MAG TPA: discoidin domain-containing protein [Gemmatimonadaceae bacterium]|nr:discoidin domain-containing protein [Gemmatimonadaceae bacterium]